MALRLYLFLFSFDRESGKTKPVGYFQKVILLNPFSKKTGSSSQSLLPLGRVHGTLVMSLSLPMCSCELAS